MTDIRALTEADWWQLRAIRLRALRDAPHAFTSNYYREAGWDESWWRDRLRSDIWLLAFRDRAAIRPTGVISATRESANGSVCRYINSLWVAPAHRRRHIAASLIHAIVERLARDGADSVSLWVLEGNQAALRLYLASGFRSTDNRQLLPGSVNQHEERMTRRLPHGTALWWQETPRLGNNG